MDEDTRWLHSTLEEMLPGHSLTIWRGVTPLTGWWLVVCARGDLEWQFMLRHVVVTERDRLALMERVTAKELIPQ